MCFLTVYWNHPGESLMLEPQNLQLDPLTYWFCRICSPLTGAMMLVDPMGLSMSPLSPPQDAEAKPWANGDHHLSQVRSRWPTAPRGSPSKPGGDWCHVAFIKRGDVKVWNLDLVEKCLKQNQKHTWNAPKVSFTILNWMAEVQKKKVIHSDSTRWSPPFKPKQLGQLGNPPVEIASQPLVGYHWESHQLQARWAPGDQPFQKPPRCWLIFKNLHQLISSLTLSIDRFCKGVIYIYI